MNSATPRETDGIILVQGFIIEHFEVEPQVMPRHEFEQPSEPLPSVPSSLWSEQLSSLIVGEPQLLDFEPRFAPVCRGTQTKLRYAPSASTPDWLPANAEPMACGLHATVLC